MAPAGASRSVYAELRARAWKDIEDSELPREQGTKYFSHYREAQYVEARAILRRSLVCLFLLWVSGS